mmetsp:Transcript_57786/g.122595  ORF Transcript_57786/g.122595 Transcript_57786/m.122595 type:complete len:115 (-) Transcript_57786:97-441(-)
MPPPESAGQGSVNNSSQNTAAPESTWSIEPDTLSPQPVESTWPMPEIPSYDCICTNNFSQNMVALEAILMKINLQTMTMGAAHLAPGKTGGIVGRYTGSHVMKNFKKLDTMMEV